MAAPCRRDIASLIDHSMLQPFLTDDDIHKGCMLARQESVATVCVRPSDVPLAARLLQGSTVGVCTVIGFPHGTTTTACKVAEAAEALASGCTELDMVCNVGKVKSGAWDAVRADIAAVVATAHAAAAKVKVIFEICHLTDDEILRLCDLCNELDVDWAKTSTGFGPSGADLDRVRLMRGRCKPSVQIKASGGVRTLEQVLAFRDAGCTRIGTSATLEILSSL